MHYARWMAIAIYALKVWLFRDQAKIAYDVVQNLLQICTFIAKIYINAWFSAPDPASAPRNDLNLLKELLENENVNATVSKAALKKFTAHLWYLNEQMIGLSVFDSSLPDEVRRDIVEACNTREGLEDPPKNRYVQCSDVPGMSVADLASESTLDFFKILEIDTKFFQVC